MRAFMIFSEIFHLCCDLGVSSHSICRRLLAIDDHVSTGKETLLMPLCTGTSLPSFTTDIAELGTATATVAMSNGVSIS
jgi:hypothetical protein